MPLTLGNECSGIVEQVGSKVEGFKKGDRVYTRLPIGKIGAFAEYVAVEQDAVAKMPKGYDFNTAAAIPLTGLTAYQAIVEELEAKPGQTILIPGGSGSFGQMAVPIAKALGLRVHPYPGCGTPAGCGHPPLHKPNRYFSGFRASGAGFWPYAQDTIECSFCFSSEVFGRPNHSQYMADDIAFIYHAQVGRTAVGRCVAVITHDKHTAFGDGLRELHALKVHGQFKIVDVVLLQFFAIDIDLAECKIDVDFITFGRNNTLDRIV